jgi:pectate lyase
MKRQLLSGFAALASLCAYSQKPDFALVGFGVGTVGGTGGTTVNVSNYDQLAANVVGTDKKIIRVNGTITAPSGGQILDVGSNKTIIGVGNNALLSMVNLHLKNSQQIIIQNLKMSMIGSTMGSDADMISIETTSSNEVKYIWIDHCEFYNVTPTLPETAAKKDLYDGMIDIKKSSSLITISWNYFHDHWKCSLIGFTNTDVYDRKITYHHNYFKNIKSRAPSYRGGTGHIYNNFFDGLTGSNVPSSEAVNSREKACLKVESNYFRNYNRTIYCALDDVDFEGFAYGTNNTFEASAAATAATCHSFNPSYAYKLDKTADIPGIVASWSGVGKLDAAVYTLALPTVANGSIKLEPAGGSYPSGTVVTATPVANNGYAFVSWSGAVTGNQTPASITMNGNKSLSATFASTLAVEDELATGAGFKVYPSPVSSLLSVDFQSKEGGDVQVFVKNHLGQTVHTAEMASAHLGFNSIQFDVSHLQSGVYHCVVMTNGQVQSKMFVKK